MLRVEQEKMHFDRVRPTLVTRAPRRVVCVVCELDTAEPDGKHGIESFKTRLRRWHVIEANRCESGRWLRQHHEGDSCTSHWRTMAALLIGRRSCWIVSPSIGEWLASTGGYGEFTAGRLWLPTQTDPSSEHFPDGLDHSGMRPGFLVLNGPTEIIVGRYADTEIHAVAASNYGIADVRELLWQTVGVEAAKEMVTLGPGRFAGCGQAVAESLSNWYCGMIDEWLDSDSGVWAETAAKCSWSFYKRRYASGELTFHQNVKAHKMERAALYGGRAEVYRRGSQVGSFTRLDVRSMYPSILSAERAPVGLSHLGGPKPVAYLQEAAQNHCVVARVTIDTQIDAYPFRLWVEQKEKGVNVDGHYKTDYTKRKKRTIYPVGVFTTTLCGPEFCHAARTGAIDKVIEYALYRTSGEFAGMLSECIAKRRAAEFAGESSKAKLWKLVANSFAGRFARRNGGWISEPRLTCAEAWSEWFEQRPLTTAEMKRLDAMTPRESIAERTRLRETVRCRSIGFLSQYFQRETDDPVGFPILFAWLTACGRQRLHAIVQACGEANVLQTDTDGLWVDDEGLRRGREAGIGFGDEPGQIRIVETAESVHFVTPKHYCINGKWTMSGFSDGFAIDDKGRIVDHARRTLYHADTADGPSCVLIDRRTSDVSNLSDNHRAPSPLDGTRPWRLKDGDDALHYDSVREPDDWDD